MNMTGFKTFDSVTIGTTKKGHRVWLQTLEAAGWPAGTPYTVTFEEDAIVLRKDAESKRRVTNAKRGVIDIVSKKVTGWAQGSTTATVYYAGATIIIKRDV